MTQGEVEFSKLTARSLDPLTVVAQCLDNQWVPRSLLNQMLANGQSLQDVGDVREGLVRAEYLRALLTAKQVVVNRAFLHNADVVARDYERRQTRPAFIELLETRALVPYLFTEEAPDEPPRLSYSAERFSLWRAACREAPNLGCLRLAWDARNKSYTAGLAGAFHAFVTGAYSRAHGDYVDEFSRHLALSPDQGKALRRRFRDMRDWAQDLEDEQDGPVTREQFYKKFVLPDGDPVAGGRCDRGKPFSAELKQLVDLQYNTALPEFLDRLPLRPADTLHRAALREPVPSRRGGDARLDDFEQVLRTRLAFDSLADDLDPLQTPFLLDLDLPAVARVRKTPEWQDYVAQLTGLLAAADPALFETFASSLLDRYGEVLRLLGQQRKTHAWLTQRRAALDVAGVVLRVAYGRNPTFQLVGQVADDAPGALATVRFRLVNRLRLPKQAPEPELAFDTLTAWVEDPAAFIHRMRWGLAAAGFEELPALSSAERQRPGGLEKDLGPTQAA